MGNFEMHGKWLGIARNEAQNISIYVIPNDKHN